MSACPLPENTVELIYPEPAEFTADSPQPSDESCTVVNTHTVTTPGGGPSTTITQTIHCAGPQGPQGEKGDPGEDGECGMIWQDEGSWVLGREYYQYGENQEFLGEKHCDVSIVRHNSKTYRCIYGHISDELTEPGVGDDWLTVWSPFSVGGGMDDEDKDLFDSFFDWITDIENWGVGDWLKAIAGLATLGYAAASLIDLMSDDGKGNGQAGSTFNGTPAYSGSPIDGTLPDIITHLCKEFPFPIDVSLLANKPVSFKIAHNTPIRNILQQLSLIYGFSIVPSGTTLRFIPWETPSVKYLALNDIGFNGESSKYRVERKTGIDLPKTVYVNYVDRSLNYQDNVVHYSIESFEEGTEIEISVPFVISQQEALNIAERSCILTHLEATKFSYNISFAENMELEPGDTIEIESIGKQRIVSLQILSNGLIEVSSIDADYITKAMENTGSIADLPQALDTVPEIGYSTAIFLDLPAIYGTDNQFRVYAAVSGYGDPNWPGCGIYESLDGGVTYSLVKTVVGQESTIGRVENAISASSKSYHFLDEDTTITVELKSNSLISVPYDQLLMGANLCMVGTEMIAFRDAILTGTNANGNKIYELSGLFRGLQGTEWAITEHENDEVFVLIDGLVELPYDKTRRMATHTHKIVTLGSDLSKVDPITFQPYGINLVPWRVGKIHIDKLGTTNDYIISWDERVRFFGSEFPDYVDPTRDDDWGGWYVNIMNATDDEVRTVHVVSNNFTYTEAMQQADFGSVQSNITVKIIQMSTEVGGGYSRTESYL